MVRRERRPWRSSHRIPVPGRHRFLDVVPEVGEQLRGVLRRRAVGGRALVALDAGVRVERDPQAAGIGADLVEEAGDGGGAQYASPFT